MNARVVETSLTKRPKVKLIAGVIDQGVYSLGNILLTVAIATSVSATEFGYFATLYAVFLILLVTIRGAASDWLLVSYESEGDADLEELGGHALRVAIRLGALAMLLLLTCAGILWAGHYMNAAVISCALGVAILPVCAQDTIRFIGIAAGRPSLSLCSDVVALGFQAAVFSLLITRSADNVAVWVLTWAGAQCVGVLIVQRRLKIRLRGPKVVAGPPHLSWQLAADNMTSQFLQQGVIFLAAAVSVVEAGSYRGAQTLFMPFAILVLGARSVVTPHLTRKRTRLGDSSALRGIAAWAMILSLGQLLYAGVVFLVPTRLGSLLLGETWPGAERLLLPVGLAMVAGAGLNVFVIGLRVMGHARLGLRLRVASGVMLLVCAAWAGGEFEVLGVVWAVALGTSLQAVVWGIAIGRLWAKARRWDGSAESSVRSAAT